LLKKPSNVALSHHMISILTEKVEVLRLCLLIILNRKSVDLVLEPVCKLNTRVT